MKSLNHLNLPLILMVNTKVREVGRIDISADWTFKGWVSTSIADALQLETNLGSVALNPVADYIVTDDAGELILDEENPHNHETLQKVRHSLSNVGLDEEQITYAINDMQNKGLLFRERASNHG